MALQYSPKIVTDGLVMCLDASQNKSYPTTDLPVKGGLALWLDASDDSTFSYSSSTSVSQWRDKSGLNNHANQSVAGNQPSRNTFNSSRKSVNFVSSGVDYLLVSANSNLALPDDASIFIVYKPATQTTQYAVLLDNYHGQGGAYGFVIQRVSTNNQFYYANGNGSTFVDASASPWTYTDNVIQLLSLNKSGANATPYISGTAQTTRTVYAATAQYTTGLVIGAWGLGGREYNGDMCEILIFNRALSSTEMKQVHTYLGQKWGILNTDRSIIDLSGFNDNGLLGNGTTANMPLYDYYNKGSFLFDGSNDFIQYPSLLNLSNVFTINFWIKPTSNTRQTIISNGYPYLANKGFFLVCPGNNSTDLFLSLGNDQKIVISNTGAITTGIVQMVTAVANGAGSLMKLYVNGIEVSYTTQQNADISLQYDSGVFVTGKRDTTSADYLSSNLYALQIYNRALSTIEISQNYEAQKSKFANTIVQQGLVLNLDAGNPYSYAGAGTTWYDVSGNSYNGTLTNSPTYSSDNGGSLAFNGSNNYIVTSNFTPNITNKTLSGWVKLSSISQQGGGLINLQSTDGLSFDAIVYNETNNGWGFGSNGFSRTGWSGVKETSTNDWVNITATYENLNYRIYRNGVLIYTLTSFNTLNFNFSSNSLLGYRHLGGGSAFLAGNIAQGLIYNRALSAAEVLQNYNATKGRFGL